MKMDLYDRIQHAYDRIVLEYARLNHSSMSDYLVALARELAGRVGPQGKLIEIGCGTGRDMHWFETQGLAVTGIDLSAQMLSYARKHVRGSLVQMNMCRLGFRSASFDGTWCCASLLHLPKSEAGHALREIRRVLKRDATLILSIQEGSGETWEESYVPGVERFFARYQPAEMENLLTQNGFSVSKWTSTEGNNRKWLAFIASASTTSN